MPLNMFGIMLSVGVLMVYIIATDIYLKFRGYNYDWHRWEWYVVDTLMAISIIKVANMSSKINNLLNCFSKKKG